MKLLAIDTSSLACSVALACGGDIVERHEERAREHTRLLVPMIHEVMADRGVRAEDLTAIVLGNGPGSFIGMRIAASVAQGLAHGAGLRIVPVSSLAGVAVEVFGQASCAEVVVAQDAHMNEVYLGVYARDEFGLPVAVFPERLQGQTVIDELDAVSAGDRIAAGAGWQRYARLLAANEDRIANSSAVLYPRARHLLPLGKAALGKGLAILPQDIAPAYLRNNVAERPRGQPP
jgi:tRNA threonylcarbamoyladenosine biosynthesis protein TsaB